MNMCIESARTPSQRYPQRQLLGKVRPETHTVWFNAHGVLPNGWMLHTCDNPRCVDLDHLFEGSNSDNIKDCVSKGRNPEASKTHCKNGHEFTERNTYVRTSRGWTERMCRRCRADRQNLSRA